MPHVERDASGNIVGLYANLQDGYAEEFLNDDDAEVVAFQGDPIKATSFPDLTARQFWLAASRINITKADVLTLVDAMEDQDAAEKQTASDLAALTMARDS